MLILQEGQLKKSPLLDVLQHHNIVPPLEELIREYIAHNKQRLIINGQPTEALYISGFAPYHHQRLAHYCQQTRPANIVLTIQNGYFSADHLPHCWLQYNNLIIDITIAQFAHHPTMDRAGWRPLLDHAYFIADNPQNIIYQLYRS